jgi:hypothetical protein
LMLFSIHSISWYEFSADWHEGVLWCCHLTKKYSLCSRNHWLVFSASSSTNQIQAKSTLQWLMFLWFPISQKANTTRLIPDFNCVGFFLGWNWLLQRLLESILHKYIVLLYSQG